ncbi:Maf family protein [Yoonia sediminilitoris]|uniref:dTTP/UTP pyrophosphatase n=1 Tax=Yoonia sediminilitoris TaxID=1286148 RepID=A0A2T6KI42_9RHOB|nr:nucleoside triphosphate pyrophosphatase [Yoonia sediminilitoris]PUB15394.1 septum formation protein [Yoonia sediminilitoris]RCW96004.1 septum formation protein [Yoonia sediminilitoris]
MTTLQPDHTLKLILGSGSPRRLELLAQIGLAPDDVRPPDINEDVGKAEVPRDYVNRIAGEKAAAVTIASDEVALCADTTVALGRRILGKPQDRDEAAAFLRALSGRRHKVITAIAVKRGDRVWQKDVQTTVAVKRLSEQDVQWYVGTGDWQGKAGGYAIQGPASAFIPWINGSFHAVMGLPLPETVGLLIAAGYPVLGASQ